MSGDLAGALAAIVGAAHVATDAAARARAGADLFPWPDAVLPELVIRPGSTAEVQDAMRALAASGRAAVPRGAGLSYTAGVVPHAPAVVIDLTRLAHVAIDADDLHARVGAGATWAALAAAAAAHGLRPAAPAPISGSHTTIGGAASQGLPGTMEGFLGLEVVLADGTALRTGSAARPGASPFWRQRGPDLTGMFLGDCGAFGIKTELVLRLAPDQTAAFASFAFDDGAALVAAIAALMRAGVASRCVALDRQRAADAARLAPGEAALLLGAVIGGAGTAGQGLRDAAQMLRAGLAGPESARWSLHVTTEGHDAAAADSRLALARRLCAHGRAIDNAVPKALRARPFSIRGMVGPAGERWVPVHGILPLSRAAAALAALEAALAAAAPEMDRVGMRAQWLIAASGPAITLEPMLLWPDALDELHLESLGPTYRARFAGRPVNMAGRALATRLRAVLRDILAAEGAVQAQIGRYYAHAGHLAPGSESLLRRIKQALDPESRMNPGALGLEPPGAGQSNAGSPA